MTPWSRGCRTGEMLGGRKITSVAFSDSVSGLGCAVQLSTTSKTSRFSNAIFRSNSCNQCLKIFEVIQAFAFDRYSTGSFCMRLKQRGCLNLPMVSSGSFSDPSAFAHTNTVIRSFDRFFPFAFVFSKSKSLIRHCPPKKTAVSSALKTFLGSKYM